VSQLTPAIGLANYEDTGRGHADDVTGRARGAIGRRGRRVASYPIVSIFVTPGASFRHDEKGWPEGEKVPRGDTNGAEGRDYPPRARLIDRVSFRRERGITLRYEKIQCERGCEYFYFYNRDEQRGSRSIYCFYLCKTFIYVKYLKFYQAFLSFSLFLNYKIT